MAWVPKGAVIDKSGEMSEKLLERQLPVAVGVDRVEGHVDLLWWRTQPQLGDAVAELPLGDDAIMVFIPFGEERLELLGRHAPQGLPRGYANMLGAKTMRTALRDEANDGSAGLGQAGRPAAKCGWLGCAGSQRRATAEFVWQR